ncbi:DUF305 domain-containing protein [Nocardioides marmoriginsengisoli]|uniref:DUF305 domain-containing protein n=1 Tax=Nocardioides marmoriginsengisoli TaxID=661483 RepID=A0A3N0CDE4_9ACTN|nr:DUF305 domain-containing protein [Nocardioides marmoriginsengisoli]RNL61261.1 DUF305 domain-containing protein [Nocardioides marmoriginsengisoli]
MNYPATKRSLLLALSPLVLILAVAAGCGNDKDEPLSSTRHNDADVAFATDMIQHHAQALAMVNLTVERPLDPEVKAVTEGIRAAQAPEIETMVDWLQEWDEDVPETVNDHMNHDMGTTPEGTDEMPGMMSAEEMKELEEAPDSEFQKLWLEMMVEHHRGAIEMAGTEVEDGRYQPAVDLAKSIVSSQSDEVEELKRLIAGL